MNQMTLRHIPKPVENRLRDLAQQSGQSINKTIIALLKKALGLDSQSSRLEKKRDVSSALRGWTKKEYEEFENNTKIFEQIDEEVWK